MMDFEKFRKKCVELVGNNERVIERFLNLCHAVFGENSSEYSIEDLADFNHSDFFQQLEEEAISTDDLSYESFYNFVDLIAPTIDKESAVNEVCAIYIEQVLSTSE